MKLNHAQKITLLLIIFCLAVVSGPVLAQQDEDGEDLYQDDAPVSEEILQSAEEEPLDLGSLEVTGVGLSFRQELTLRMLRSALGKSKSRKRENKDDWVCWIDRATGSSFRYLNCARNGDLWALERPFGITGPTIPDAGYGAILRTSRPVNEAKLKRVMAQLGGPEDFDDEFLALAAQGDDLPRDIPTDEELESFAAAYKAVGNLQKRGRNEQSQVKAIEANGLTLERYNHIADLTETYQSIENAIAVLLE